MSELELWELGFTELLKCRQLLIFSQCFSDSFLPHIYAQHITLEITNTGLDSDNLYFKSAKSLSFLLMANLSFLQGQNNTVNPQTQEQEIDRLLYGPLQNHLYPWCPTMLRERSQPYSIWFAGRTWKNNSKWYTSLF